MQLKLNKEEFYLLDGPAEVAVNQGCVEIIGARLPVGKKLVVPVGKKNSPLWH